MLVTPLPIVTEVKLKQSEKAPLPMLVTLLGIVTEVKPEHPLKASHLMLVTLYAEPSYSTDSGITISPEYLSLFDTTVACFDSA